MPADQAQKLLSLPPADLLGLGRTIGEHYCFECLPRGFPPEEARILPLRLRCTECTKIKHRDGFSRSLKERIMSTEDMEQFEQCVSDSLVVCNLCKDLKQRADDLLVCSRCERSLDRSNFSLAQQRIAKQEDEGLDHLVSRTLVYVCKRCCTVSAEYSKDRDRHVPAKRERERDLDDRRRRSPSRRHRDKKNEHRCSRDSSLDYRSARRSRW